MNWFFTFRINRIANFPIRSNEFRMNPISDNLKQPVNGVKSNLKNFHCMFWMFFAFSNQQNCKFTDQIKRILNAFQLDSTTNMNKSMDNLDQNVLDELLRENCCVLCINWFNDLRISQKMSIMLLYTLYTFVTLKKYFLL